MRVENVHNTQFDDLADITSEKEVKWWQYAAYVALLFIVIFISNVEVAFASEKRSPLPPAWLDDTYMETEVVETKEPLSWFAATGAQVVETEPEYYIQTFTISAYYSPIQGQSRYVTGSLAGDIRLNGSGVNGADGTPVYPGMIAAPPSFAFGTKMHIPGVGTVAVHDRGGAIKGNRLDVWMGYGDKGLTRALQWGKRTLDVKVYGINPDIVESIELADYDESERQASGVPQSQPTVNAAPSQPPASTKLFSRQLNIGSSGNDVAELQKLLKDLNYYDGDINSVFDEATHTAVARFQVNKNIVPTESSYGAGYVGPLTSSILASAANGVEKAHAQEEKATVDNKYEGSFASDLKLGDSGAEVKKLQQELQRVNLFGIEPTGYYGELTEHAVFKFQQTYKLAGDKMSPGAGIFGPITRSKMNEIVAARLKTRDLIQ